MAALHELIAQVQDDNLRGQLQAEFNKLRDEKIFEFSRQDLICVSRLGEPIYPGLTRLI